MTAEMLRPRSDDDSAGFWEGCRAGELRVQRCDTCGNRQFPPRPMCAACGSFAVGWEAVSGRGRIWSFVVAHPPLLPAYARYAPYNVIVVELAEDPTLRMVGNLIDGPDGRLDSVDPASIEIGEPVEVVFTPLEPAADSGEGAGNSNDNSADNEDEVILPRWVRAAPSGKFGT